MLALIALIATTVSPPTVAGQKRPNVSSLRMYVFPLGNIPLDNPGKLFTEPLTVAKGGYLTVDRVEDREATGRLEGPRIDDMKPGNEVRTQL